MLCVPVHCVQENEAKIKMFLRQINAKLRAVCVQSMQNALTRNISGTLDACESELIDKWKQKFESANIPEIDVSLEHILDHVLHKDKVKTVPTAKTIVLTEEQSQHFEQLCECRAARMPIQYIIGEWDFCDLVLKMVPPVFIPRPETEELVELMLQQCDSKSEMRFMEIGCGSGAISLALLHALPKASCVSIDQSELACKLTLENATNLDLINRMKIFKHKLTEDSQLPEVEGEFDMIVSNPPYVLTKDLVALDPEISLYEDLRALDGGDDGMNVIRSVLKFSAKRLRTEGQLWLEVDPTHPKLIEQYVEERADELEMKFVASYKDMFGKERFVEIVKV